jgi:hypothetical protein
MPYVAAEELSGGLARQLRQALRDLMRPAPVPVGRRRPAESKLAERRAREREMRTAAKLADQIRANREQLGDHRTLHLRTLRRYLSLHQDRATRRAEPLSRRAAFEIVFACRRLRWPISAELENQVFAGELEPAGLILPNQARRWADKVSRIAAELGVPQAKVEALRKRLTAFFESYQRLNEIDVVNRHLRKLLAELERVGKPWDLRLHEMLSADVAPDGRAYTVHGPLRRWETALRKMMPKP